MMNAKGLWLRRCLAIAVVGMSLGGTPGIGSASVPVALATPSGLVQAAALDTVPQPEPDRPEAPAAPDSLGTSLFISGTSPAYVQVAHSAALDPSAEMTLEAWVRRGVVGCQTIIGKDYLTSYWFGMCNGVLRFYSGGSGTFLDGNTPIPANVWTHVAVTWKSGGQRVYYINGQEDYRAAAGADGTSASALGIGYDVGSSCCEFKGNLAEVRLWNIARTAEDIRRTMHVRLDEPRPGLVASWNLNDSYADSVGGYTGAAGGSGTINFSGPQPPPRPPLVPIDKDFAQLADPRDGFGFAVLSTTNRALMVGGYGSSGRTGQILRLDLGSGSAVAFGGGLPSPRYGNTAAYAPLVDKVFAFGGEDASALAQSTIYAITAATGAVTTLGASLPAPQKWANAVYHPSSGRIAVIGGLTSLGYSNGILSFDPSGGVIQTHTLTLPEPRSQAAVAASSATGHAYLIGGRNAFGAVSSIYDIDLGDGLTGGNVTTSTAALPFANYGASAVEDPLSKLIYIVGGTGTDAETVKVFDPVTGQLWVTRLTLPGALRDGGGAYDSVNRNIVFAGGYNASTIWRIPVGDGPQLRMARWDWLAQQPQARVNAIHGEGPAVAVGTDVAGPANGLYLYTEGGRANPAIGLSAGQNVNDVRYSAANDQAWVAASPGLKVYGPGNSVQNYTGLTARTVKAVDLLPGYTITDNAPAVGPGNGGMWWRDYSNIFFDYYWNQRYGAADVVQIRHRAPNDIWSWSSNLVLSRTTSSFSFPFTTIVDENHGTPCFVFKPSGMAFDRQGDLWLVGSNDAPILGPERPSSYTGICRISDPAGAGTVNEFTSPLGDDAAGISVDRDGQIYAGWLSTNDGTGQGTGGLQVFQNLGGTIRTDAMNWMTAPVGSKFSYAYGGQTNWASSVFEVGAVDEKLWYSSTLGLGTYAPRWQQLDAASALGDCYVSRVMPVRGRLFASAQCEPTPFFDRSLVILQPDGKTAERRNTYPSQAYAAHGDSRGRIWVGFDDGVRLYTADGWRLFTDTVGAPPASVYAIAEDQAGRIWLGGGGGLTLYDRDRFVATFTTANSSLPGNAINALLVDQTGALWIGTNAGLARYADNAWTTFTTANGLPSNAVASLAQGSDGRLAASTTGGLAFFDGASFAAESVPGSANGAPLATDDLGRVWHGNAVRMSGGWVPFYNTNSGLVTSGVADVASDGSGLMWFAFGGAKGISARGSQLPPLGTVLPTVSAISPSSGSAGAIVTITGTGFSPNTADIDVVIGGARAELVSASPTRLQVRIGPNTLSGSVSVSSRGQRVNYSPSGNNAFCAIPVIGDFTPSGGNAGVQVVINGSNFDYGSIRLGSGAFRAPASFGPQQLRAFIETGDTNGNLTVRNITTGGCPGFTASAAGFRKFSLTVGALDLNQGMAAYGLMADMPTLMSAFFTRDQARRSSDAIEIDTLQYVLRDANGFAITRTINQLLNPPTSLTGVPAALRADTINAVNIPDTPAFSSGAAFYSNGGALTTSFSAFRNGRLVGQLSRTDSYRPNREINILLVPMVPTNPTTVTESIATMRARVLAEEERVRRKMMPTGRVNLIWSPEAYRETGTVTVGDFFQLYDKGHGLDMIRQRWNERHPDQRVLQVFGVVEQSIKRGTATGFAFGAQISEIINLIAGPIDTLCDIGSALVTFFTFGLVDPGGCHLEVPVNVGLIDSSGGNAGRLGEIIAHEMGHTFGLVMPWAQNGDLTDNISHSTHDEISNGECSNGTLIYDFSRTLHVQPNVTDPVVDPISGRQYRPQLSVDDVGVTGTFTTDRGKALMSYNCTRNDSNEFFEPVDVVSIFMSYAMDLVSSFTHDLRPGALRPEAAPGKTEAPPALPRARAPEFSADRLYVSGVITPGAPPTGDIARIESLGPSASTGMPFATGVWLVQKDAGGTELRRDGILVLYQSSAGGSEFGSDGVATAVLSPNAAATPGYFAALVTKATGVTRVELVSGTQALDSFSAGGAAPSVSSVVASVGATTLDVSWSASDGDADPMRYVVEFSADGGSTWTPVGETNGMTIAVGLSELPGTTNGRARVLASDGLNVGIGDAPSVLVIATKPPVPYISQPTTATLALEGRAVSLSGAAFDLQDGRVSDEELFWSSNRDGALGVGPRLSAILSVGIHTVTLLAKNNAGLSATASVTLLVQGDYDFDGLSDAREMGLGLNPLTDSDAQNDADGDGLPLVMELLRHTNPALADSDGDGTNDADEIAAGTDPLNSLDNPASRPANVLQVSPRALTYTVDLSLDTVLPQQSLVIWSQAPLSWTLAANVGWVAADKTAGSTLDAVTILIDVFEMREGVSTGVLTFTNPASGQTALVPVRVDLSNKAGYCDVNGDGASNAVDINLISAALGATYGQLGYQRRLDLNRDGVINAVDVTLAGACVYGRAMLPTVRRP